MERKVLIDKRKLRSIVKTMRALKLQRIQSEKRIKELTRKLEKKSKKWMKKRK